MFIGLPPSPEEACGCETMSEIASTCLASKTGYQQSCCEDSNPIIEQRRLAPFVILVSDDCTYIHTKSRWFPQDTQYLRFVLSNVESSSAAS